MKRKVVSQGPSSMMVSLPIKWVKEFGIKKGDEVDILQEGRELIVSSEKRKVGGVIEINLESSDGLYVFRHLQAAYVAGYDEIKFNYSDSKVANTIQESIMKFLIGVELVSQDEKSCVVKSITSGKIEEFDILMKRIFQGILQMSEILYSFLKGEGDLDMIQGLEIINNRQVLHLQRIISQGKRGGQFLYSILLLLEKVANEYKYIFYDKQKRKKKSDNILKYYSRLHKQIENIYDVFVNYNSKKISKIVLEDIRTEEFKVLFKEDAALTYSFMTITDLLRSLLVQLIHLEFVGK